MNKKIYTAPNIDVVELQGEVVLSATSGGDNIINDRGAGGPTISINNGTIGSVNSNGEYESGAYFDVWEDE